MSEPRRLFESSEGLERALLVAARARAPRESKQRALAVALKVAGGGASAAAGASAGGASASAGASGGAGAAATGVKLVGSLGALKLLGAVSILGAGALAAAVYSDQTEPQRFDPPSHTTTVAAPCARPLPSTPPPVPGRSAGFAAPTAPEPSPSLAPVPARAPSPSLAPVPAHAPAPSTATASPSPSPLRAELGLLADARAALESGDPARALSLLDDYSARFPGGSMSPEATMLRIEALVKAGDRPAAVRLAQQVTASDPHGFYAARIHSLLGTIP